MTALLRNRHVHVFQRRRAAHEARFDHWREAAKEESRDDHQCKQCRLHDLSAVGPFFFIVSIAEVFVSQVHRQTEGDRAPDVRSPDSKHDFPVCQLVRLGSFAALKSVIRYEDAECARKHDKDQLGDDELPRNIFSH